MFQLEWSTREILVGVMRGRKEAATMLHTLLCICWLHLVGVRMWLDLWLFHLSLYPPSASPASGPGVHVFSFVTKCPGLCRTTMTSRSKQQALPWISIILMEFHHVLAFLRFTSIFPSQLPALWTSNLSIRQDNHLTEWLNELPRLCDVNS